jgi:hypothetical protein
MKGAFCKDTENSNLEDEREIALRNAIMERERMRLERGENLPGPPGPGIIRAMRRSPRAGEGSTDSADTPGVADPGTETTAGVVTVEGANTGTLERPPVMPEDGDTPLYGGA